MQGHIDLDVVACNAVISACEKCEKWQQACFLLAEMGGFGIRPNAVTFNAAVSACGAAGEWEYSLSLFQKMQLSGLHPDTISHNAVITAFEAGCQWQMAWQLLWEREQGGSCDVPSRPIKSSILHRRIPATCYLVLPMPYFLSP